MRCFTTILALLTTHAAAHGVLTSITGANGVKMPGLSVIDGTPRDSTDGDAQVDVSIISDDEIASGTVGPLGRNAAGAIDPTTVTNIFMSANATRHRMALRALLNLRTVRGPPARRQTNGTTGEATGKPTPGGTVETGIADAAGVGATKGLPTADDNGVVTLNFHQVNADGAGPLDAQVDATSGGTDAAAFKNAQVLANVPGDNGISDVESTDFQVRVQVPAGTACTGTIGDANNACVVRIRNPAGPFGGSAAFTMGQAAQRKALRKKGVEGKFRADRRG
jgi:hypothetical protein